MKDKRQLLMVAMVALIVLALLFLIVLLFPPLLVDHTMGVYASTSLPPADRLKAENDVRATLLQALAGVFFIFTAYFTWRQIQNSQNQLALAQRQLAFTREQHINDRFSKAVEHLASEKPDISLGGVYSLEEIARSSPDYRGSVSQILSAFVRRHSPWPPSKESKYPAGYAAHNLPALVLRDVAVQAALTVLGRQREYEAEPWRYDLGQTDLRAASLPGANFSDTYLGDSNLSNADLAGADLRGADLQRADLRQVNLTGAKLSGANLSGADLSGAYLTSAILSAPPQPPGTPVVVGGIRRQRDCPAKLTGANLAYAHFGPRVDYSHPGGLVGPGLRGGASLSGVDFTNATGLKEAHFQGAFDDGTAQWPDDFDRTAAGLVTPGDLAGVEKAPRAAGPPSGR